MLEYSNDYHKLYFTTSLHHSILCFSLVDGRVISTTFPHPSPPTVLILSKDSSVLVTASERPVVIYVHNLKHLTAPPILHPQVSPSPVTSGEFHPDKNGVFLLCFLDGTIALYNVPRGCSGNYSEDKQSHLIGLHGCEKSCFKRLHKTVNVNIEPGLKRRPSKEASVNGNEFLKGDIGKATCSIAGAAFVPGYRSRAVSVGADGKCRLIDFENEGKLLRTWHIGASATCLSILGSGDIKPALKPANRRSSGHKIRNTDYIIAIGRADGIVMLYDSVGLLLQEWNVSETKARIISIDWSLSCTIASISDANANKPEDTIINVPTPEDTAQNNLPRESSTLNDKLKINAPLPRRKVSNVSMSNEDGIHDTIIAMSKDDLTRHRAPLVTPGKLVDLFSSAKKAVRQNQPYRLRPRLSSSTFVANSQIPGNRFNSKSTNNIVVKGFRCHLLPKCQRLALDGQNSYCKAKLKPREKLPREVVQNQHQKLKECEEQREYPIPGSYFSSESSTDDESNSGMSENSKVSRSSKGPISGVCVPMSGTSSSQTSSSHVKSKDPYEFDPTKKLRSSLSMNTLDESLEEQHSPSYQNTQVIKDAFSASSSSAGNEGALKGPRRVLSAIQPYEDWDNRTKIFPIISNAPLPRLTVENLNLKQATIQDTSLGQLPYQTDCNSITERYSTSDKDLGRMEAEQLPVEYKDIRSCALQKSNIKDNAFAMQHGNCSHQPTCCIDMEELRQLNTRTERILEKVTVIHKLMQCYDGDISHATD